MRVRLTRFYRGYPELSEYSDEECRRLVLQARVRRGDVMWIMPLAFIAAFLVVAGPVGLLGGYLLWESVNSPIERSTLLREYVGLAVALAGVGVVVIWIGTRRELAIRSVLLHLSKARCPYCAFNLQGLREEEGAVTCPECGEQVVLADEGIKLEYMLPREARGKRAWKPGKGEAVELPPIPLEPEGAPTRRKTIWTFGSRRKDGEGRA